MHSFYKVVALTEKSYGHFLFDVSSLQYLAKFIERDHPIAVFVGFDYGPFDYTAQLLLAV